MIKKEKQALGEKEQELIAVGASVASGCLPCTKFHRRAASSVGADEAEILQAVRDATAVRRAASELMARAGGLPSAEADGAFAEQAGCRSLIRELVGIAAAYAINCSASLETHMAAARDLGATDGQIFAALKITCAIRNVACQKAKTVAGSFFGVDEEQAVACDCSEDDVTSIGGADKCAPDNADCHCRPGDLDDSTNLDQI